MEAAHGFGEFQSSCELSSQSTSSVLIACIAGVTVTLFILSVLTFGALRSGLIILAGDRATLLRAASGTSTRKQPQRGGLPSITLVGAGPGSPDLLTMAAASALASAEVVICDLIAPKELRALAPANATFLVASKIPGRSGIAQDEREFRFGQRI